jgi:AraC-like DNA-binding protein
MALFLVNSSRQAVRFEKANSAVLAYPALAGSQVLSYQSKELQLLVKELVTELFTIRFNLFRFSRNQAIESFSEKAGLHSRAVLQSELHFSVEAIGTLHQQQGTVSMIRSNSAHCTALYEGGKEYKTLDIYFSPQLVAPLQAVYPELGLEEEDGPPRLLLSQPCFLKPGAKAILNQILDCAYDEETSHFYFDLKVREYLFTLLEGELHAGKSRYRFTPYETEQVHRARELLLANLGRPPLTIRALARQVGVNEFRLKEGFRHFYGRGVFETFQEARMDHARELLLTTNKPIKEIAGLAGYPRTTNFITAFRKYFDLTPASLRRGR